MDEVGELKRGFIMACDLSRRKPLDMDVFLYKLFSLRSNNPLLSLRSICKHYPIGKAVNVLIMDILI